MTVDIARFDGPAALNHALARDVSQGLTRITSRGRQASLAVSGGRTPVGLFQQLADMSLDWERVHITLTDERCVPADSEHSNEHLLRQHLLQEQAVRARFLPLGNGAESDRVWLDHYRQQLLANAAFPFDLCLLGMGNDGHTASLFPCSANIADLMAADNTELVAMVQPRSAAYTRLSFTFAALRQSRHIILHINGQDKMTTLERALSGDDVQAMPIRAFLQDSTLSMKVYWAP